MARGAIAVESGLQNHPNTDPAPLISPNLIDPSFASERQRALKGQDWWFWEITTAIVSLLSFFAIIAILAFLSEKPLSIWSFSIAPNALIAVFTTLSKTAVMVPLAACIGQLKWPHYQNNFRALSHIQLFDDSSRGPWGAFVFIWRMRVSTPLASIAALLVIIALGMEPFTQVRTLVMYSNTKC